MSTSHLVAFPKGGEPESPADRIRRLQAEARGLAREHIELLCGALNEVARLAGEIADGGDLYPVGSREFGRRLVAEMERHVFTLTAIADRDGA